MRKSRLWLLIVLLVVAVLAIFCSVIRGGSVRYSPYALSYRGSGLVADNMNYSPYALNHRGSGLVPDGGTGYGNNAVFGFCAKRPLVPRDGTVVAVIQPPRIPLKQSNAPTLKPESLPGTSMPRRLPATFQSRNLASLPRE